MGDYVGHNMSDSFNCSCLQFPLATGETLIYIEKKYIRKHFDLYSARNVRNSTKWLPELLRYFIFRPFAGRQSVRTPHVIEILDTEYERFMC